MNNPGVFSENIHILRKSYVMRSRTGLEKKSNQPDIAELLVFKMVIVKAQIDYSYRSYFIFVSNCGTQPGSNFFEKTPLFFRYSGVNAANAANLQAKRR